MINICTTLKLEPYYTRFTKINSIWIKDLNIMPDNIKLLKENAGKKLLDIGPGNVLFCFVLFCFVLFGYETQSIKTKVKSTIRTIKLKVSAQ